MRIIKTAKQHRPCPKKPALSTLLSKNGCCLLILILLFQFFPVFFFGQGGSLIWALDFQTSPRAIDDIAEDTIFSPNGDGVQDVLLISFVTDGDFGDFRIIIDTHGPSGVGKPDGHFRADEDWVITGELGPDIDEDDPPKAIREAWNGNDFSRQQEDKSPRLLNDRRYRILIEIDAIPNEEVNRIESGYRAVELAAIIDNTPPQLSATVSQQDFSPNADTITDKTRISYGLSESLAELELQFTEPSDRPAVPLTRLTVGNHSFTWDGADGLGTTLSDGVYAVQLHGTDKGGNVGTFAIDTIQIDTEPPIIAQMTPSRNSFQNTVEQIEAIFDVDDGSLIDVESTSTTIVLRNANGAQINGILSHDEDAGGITLTLDRPLNSSDDNGVYTINVSGADKAGNIVRDTVTFTFDNIAPTIASIATDAGELTPDTNTTTKFTFLDVTLADNIDSRVNTASTIRLSRVEGAAVAGIQSQFGENGLRWTPGFPLATDGSDDGAYTIVVQSRDRAGNEVEIQIPFTYDTQAPELASLTSETGIQLNPSEGAKTFLNSSLSVVTAIFDDENGGGVDFSKTSVRMVRFDQVEELLIPLPVLVEGSVTVDEDSDTLELRLTQPLERRDGSQDGTYRIHVRSTDKAGNTQTEDFDIVYDTQVPTIVSTTPAENETVSSLSQVSILLDDPESGIDFSTTAVRLLRDGSEVRADDRHNGKDTVSLTLPEPLAIDGSGEGEYIIEITPVDRANNAGATVRRRFFVASRVPEIRLNTPTETRINNLTTIDVQLFDYIGPGLDFSESKSMVTVSKNGAIVEAKPLTADEENARLVWTIDRPLSRDGSADGEYTVNVQYTDLIGEVFTEDFILNFDSQPPAITVGTRPQATNPLTADRIEVELEVIDDFAGVQGSGFDAAASTFQLFDANNTVIGGAQTDDGISIFVFRSEVLPEGGMYTLVVTLVDRAGNHGIPQWFIYDAEVPTIQAVSHIDPTAAVSNVGEFLTRVEATVSDVGTGIDFDQSLIQLLDAAGEVVPGTPYHDDEATIGWELITPLTREGNFDGLYSLRVNAIDKAGHVEEKTFALRYDTQAPTIHTALIARSDGVPIELFGSENPLITFPINQITVGFSDGEGSGMDILRTTISLIGPEGTPVGTNQTDNGVNTVFLSFNSLRTDGSDDGLYRVQVTPTDLAGNTLTSPVEFQFFYGTRKPEVISTAPAEFASVTQLTEVSATLQDHSGEGIDFDRATILLKAPDQSSVPGHQTIDEAQSLIAWELNQPLSRDGSADGEYTIQLLLVDKVGNSADVEHTFVYDTLIPTIVSVTTNTNPSTVLVPDEFASIEQPFQGVTITLSDANGETTPVSGVDLVGTGVQLLGPGNMPLDITTRDDGVDTIIVSFASLDQPGTYMVEITPRDMAGNVSRHAIVYKFNLELGYSTVSTVTISGQMAPVEFVNRLDEIVATLEDVSGTGLNLASDGSAITVTGPDGEVEGVQTSRGENQIAWRPLQLATDGSADGIYTVTVTPVNSSGRLGIPARYQFTLDTQQPEVTSITPIDLTQPLSYIGRQLIQIAAQVEDVGPAGLEVDDQRLQLLDASGNLVPAVQTNDGTSQFFLTLSQPLATDGSDDGVYTVTLDLMDKAGNLNSLSHQLIYDTLIPAIVSVTANTDPPTALPSNGLAAIESSFDRLTIKLSDANGVTTPVSGIDLVGTDVQLIGPENTSLGINTRADGVDTIIVSFASLYQPGTYTVEITPRDMAGNVSSHAITHEFSLELGHATVSAVTIGGRMAPVEFVNWLDEIVATLEDASGTGLNLTSDGSTITVTGPNGEVEGTQTSRGENEIAWRPLQLATDGSADGIYAVTITPVNSGGRLGIPARYQFTLDTQDPEVASVTPIDLTQPVSYIGQQLIQVTAQVEDVGPADLEVDDQRLQLLDASGNLVPAVQTNDGTSQFFLTLSQPLATDGSDDGVYTVTLDLMDKAGNLNSLSHQLIYDTLIPAIVSVTANTDPPTALPSNGLAAIESSFDKLTIKLSDANGEMTPVSGIDLVGTDVQLIGPENTSLGINTRADGVDSIIVSFAPLYQPGTYMVEITPRDMAGNSSSHTIEYEFGLELGPSTVSVVTIGSQMAPVEFVNRLDEIVATLEDVSATGLNLTSDGSTITVAGPDGEVEGIQTSRGGNQIVWRPLQLATDGSADGVYTVTITPVNSGGRLGIPARYQFTLDTQEPEVASVTPIDLTQPVSYIGQQLIQIAAQVEDVGPADLEVEEQRLQLHDAGGNVVPAVQSDDRESQIFLTLSQPLTADGSDDGVYTVTLDLMDRAGNLNPISHQLVYDTQAPTLVSTNPTDGSLRSDDITLITARVNDVGGSGIDFAESMLTLLDSTGTPVSGVQSNDGNRRLTLQIGGLVADGNYTIRVEAIDRAGNGSSAPFEIQFTYSSGMPVVVSTVPKTTPAEEAFTNEPLRQVSVELRSEGEGADRSTIALLAPDGSTVPGQQVRRGKLLIYRLLREFATDGSDDGTYTIVVVPINSAGRRGEPDQFTFVYDTVAPEVIPASIQLIVAEPGVNNSLVSVGALIADDEPSSGVDWDNLDLSWITLDDVRRNRKIDGTLATDEEQALLLNLIMPLASDGSQDGVYQLTIAPKDRAGNVSEAVRYPFFYDTRPPMIDTSSLFIDGQPLLTDSNDPYYPSATNKSGSIIIDAKFSDVNPDGSYGLGPDLVNSSISVSSPSGEVITGTTTQNGTDSIRFKSGPLNEQGHYQVTITSVGLDVANLGFQPTDSVTTQFLFETTKPIVELTDLVGETTFEDEPLPLQGTARDPSEDDIPASEVALVEVVGIGPDGLPIDPVAAKDDSEEEEDPWSRWSIDFLPSQSGEYNLDVRVTDRAGNAGIYDAVTVNFSVSLIFKGPTYVWPNPLSLSRRSNGEIAHFSFEVNVPGGEGARIVLSIYDFAGDLVYEKGYDDLGTGRSDNEVRWDLTNQSGIDVARGIYIFRLEAEDVVTSNRTNAVGKVVVVE